ncbi:MAG: 2-iminoacetate synthase ThiH [Desulfobacteraceae bacterium]|jgi:2-iminoacetate synthase
MSFFDTIESYRDFNFQAFFAEVRPRDIDRALKREKLSARDFLVLLSPLSADFLEPMAQKAHRLTVQYFGRTIQLFIPLYISNHCTNECVYCGFNRRHGIERRKLSLSQIESEAKAIAATGMRHLLLLTGEARSETPLDYLEKSVRLLKKYFASVAIEMFPMQEDEYRRLKAAGVDGLTLYQEVYDQTRYGQLHKAGKKTDYRYRLDAPERGAQAGFRMVNIGPLLGLGEIRSEVFLSGLHAEYLTDKYLQTEISISLPRINPAEGDYTAEYCAGDRQFVQFVSALRCFLPRAGITVSTRENAAFRDHLIRLGATRFSAGSCTGVGGYAEQRTEDTPQFEITDQRSVEQVVAAIKDNGYQPVYKDWDRIE